MVLPARSVLGADVTEASGQDRYSYDWSGFRCEIPGRMLRAGRRLLAGDWDCYLLVRGRTTWRPVRLHTPGPDAEQPAPREIAPGLSLRAVWVGGRLVLRLRPEGLPMPLEPAVSVRQSWGRDGALALALRGGPVAGDCRVVLSRLDGWGRYELPVRADDAAEGFSVAVPVGGMEAFGERGRCATDGGPSAARAGRRARGRRLGDRDRAGDRRAEGLPLFGCRPGRPRRAGPGPGRRARAGRPSGKIRRRLLRDIYYRAQRLLPVRAGTILFSSFHGKLCGDNPRAIADELRRRGDSRDMSGRSATGRCPGHRERGPC